MSKGFTTLMASACVVVAGAMVFKGREDRAENQSIPGRQTQEVEKRSQAFVVAADGQGVPSREDRSLVGQMYRDGFVTVGGQVKTPGKVAFGKGMTLGGAIEGAGGATPFGTSKRVRLIRKGEVHEFNFYEPNSKEVPLHPGDLIEVPEMMVFGR